MLKKTHIILLLLLEILAQNARAQTYKFKADSCNCDCDAFIRYRILIPDTSKPRPLIVFLHGAGERGTDNLSQLRYIDTIFASKWFQKKYPSFIIAPQCLPNKKWVDVDWTQKTIKQPRISSTMMFATMQLLSNIIVKRYPIDTTRIYVIGLSMGGFGVWDILNRMPHFFAAGVAICGGADTAIAKNIAHIPVWVFHGAEDNVVPVDLSRNMVKALKKYGAHPIYTEYPNVKHGAWFKALSNRKLYEWLFEQRNNNFENYFKFE